MTWTMDDIRRMQEQYGSLGTVTLTDEYSVLIELDANAIAPERYYDMWMQVTAELAEKGARGRWTVKLAQNQEFALVQEAANKHGLMLVPIKDEPGRYKVMKAIEETAYFGGEMMTCIMSGRQQESNPEVESGWDCIVIDDSRYYVSQQWRDMAYHAFGNSRTWVKVFKKIEALHPTPIDWEALGIDFMEHRKGEE